MSKVSKKPQAEEQGVPADAEAPASAGGQPPAKRKPPLLMVGAGAALFLASGAGVFFLAPSKSPDAAEHEAAVHGEKAKHAALSQKEPHASRAAGDAPRPPLLGTFVIAGDTGFYMPDAFVVSLDPGAGPRHLKVSLAIEAPPEAAGLYEERSLRLRDAMTTYLRAVDVAALRSPAEMGALREQIKRRVEYVVSPANVKAVLILDFILT
jgi:flagellar basal body-associated protein FliL